MSYLKHLESAAALTNTIALHRDDAVKAIERLKYQSGHSGNGVDFSNVQAAMRAVIMAAQQITDEVAKAQSGNVIEHSKQGAPVHGPRSDGKVCRLPVRPHVIATGNPPVRDYPDQPA